jgi:diadenosine tetraphosphatase ApaH/serine/threonine PP2A family protein phosphatase
VRILLLSDIHANVEALEASLDAAPEYDRAVNLGDTVGYGASPNEVTDRVRALAWLTVRGNHDKVCSGLEDVQNFNPIAALAAFWTRQNLSPENLEWLRALPQGPMTPEGVEGVQLVHGSPLDEDEYMIVVQDALEPLLSSRVHITFFGHSHIQGGFCYDNGQGRELETGIHVHNKVDKKLVKLTGGVRYLLNPGSVGQPRDGDWRAAFALYNSETHSITFYRVPYDIKKAQQRIVEAHLPERLATRLAMGR